jgi:hypothetical protein
MQKQRWLCLTKQILKIKNKEGRDRIGSAKYSRKAIMKNKLSFKDFQSFRLGFWDTIVKIHSKISRELILSQRIIQDTLTVLFHDFLSMVGLTRLPRLGRLTAKINEKFDFVVLS